VEKVTAIQRSRAADRTTNEPHDRTSTTMHPHPSMIRTIAACVFLAASAGSARSQCFDWGKEFGPRGLSGTVYASIVWNDGSGAKLYVGGNFDANGDVALRGVGTWDGTSWSPVGGGIGGAVYAFAIFDDGAGEALAS